MKCTKFPDRDAAGVCAYSGKPYSAEELVEIDGKSYAKDNLTAVMAEQRDRARGASAPTVFMNAGGGAAATAPVGSAAILVGTKSRTTAILLALFLGGIGGHKFYLRQPIWGIIYLVLFWTAIPALIGIVEAIRYVCMSDQRFAITYI